MDRRRLEAAHMRYACLMMAASYPEEFKGFSLEGDITNSLEKVTPMLFQVFERTYSGMNILSGIKIYCYVK